MKWLSIIFSFYLIALSCLPCEDEGVFDSDAVSVHHTSEHLDNDLCQPFCVCNCCGVQVFNYVPEFEAEFAAPMKPEINKSLPFHKDNFIATFSGSIWQ